MTTFPFLYFVSPLLFFLNWEPDAFDLFCPSFWRFDSKFLSNFHLGDHIVWCFHFYFGFFTQAFVSKMHTFYIPVLRYLLQNVTV